MTRSKPLLPRLALLASAAFFAFLAGCGGSKPAGPTGTTPPVVTNTANVSVSFGALGPSGGYINGVWASVTLCVPGTNTCQTIPNFLVDTGSVGVRVLSSALTVSLPPIKDSSGNGVQECVQFASFAYVWGPVAMAGVQIPGTQEQANQVPGQSANTGIPVQIISANPSPTVPSSCLATPPQGGGTQVDLNTLELLGGNGILGIGAFPQDCGSYCVTTAADQYYTCPGGTCNPITIQLNGQLWNPVSAFSSGDTNGVVLKLPAVPATGAASVTGSLIFGIGTQTDNQVGSAQVFELDSYGNFPQVVFNGVTYSSPNNGSFVDSGSDALFVSDASSLSSTGIVECPSNLSGYYCPASTASFNVTVYGSNGVHTNVPISIANAATLVNTGFAAFNNIGGDSGTDPSNDYVDLGVPFFLGRTVFVGISGSSTSYPNGYWAF